MCGIGGILGERHGLEPERLHAALAHRGPDQRGEATPHPALWLCASRLALQDATERGAQPMTDGVRTVVYNGELYNTAALARALDDAPRSSSGDTALLLAAHRRWGDAMVEHLEGMFAFALWDDDARTLLLARDPLGMKPLWIARGEARVVFASEVRALVEGRAVTPRLDPVALDSFLATGSVPEPSALLRGIEALPPGATETIALDGTFARRLHSVRARATSASRAAERVGATLRETVQAHLVGDSPIGLLLSDGVDSGALALLASGPRPSFHVRTDRDAANIAAARARRFGFEHVEIAVEGGALDDAARSWLEVQDQPSIDGLNTWIVSRAIRAAGVKAVLSGVGGDELFLGYPHYRIADRVATLGPRQLLRRPIRIAARLQAHAHLGVLRSFAGGWRAAKALELLEGSVPTGLALRRLFPAAIRRELHPHPASHVAPSVEHGPDAATRDLRGYLVDTLLRDADTMGMAHGVELRMPFLDRGLVELVLGLPDRTRRADRPKSLLLDAVPGLRALAPRQKRGFELPIERVLAGPIGAELRALAKDTALVEGCGLVPSAVRAVLADHASRPAAFRALALGSLLGWARRHGASL